MTPETLPYQERPRQANGVQLQVAEAGEPGRPLVILLHGFPDIWQGWHQQIPALEAAGFRVLAPNQRGYGRSDKPKGIAAYDIDRLAEDVVALAEAEGYSTFSLVGHDWGGIVAWWTAARFPERLQRLAILNAPHPGVFRDYLLRSPTQVLKSWYVGFFQIPRLPEAMLSARDYSLLFRSVQGSSLPGIFDESDRKRLIAAWREPGALTSMIHYYRALARRSPKPMKLRVTTPTLILWGARDPTEEPGLAEASLKLCDEARLMRLEDARHWIQREEPDLVNRELMTFLSDASSGVA
ncbi:MAG TPA: alpha/beta hydrolase [Pirellulaceae bacterium]|nr:alpha/beta hydrolase [Pirellulaceae bacterium]